MADDTPKIAPWSADVPPSRDVVHSLPSELDTDATTTKMIHTQAPFPYNPVVNRKIALWHGNMLQLRNMDAMVHPTNERFERCSKLTNALYNQAGAQLRRCLYNKLKYCPVGSIKITKGYSTNFHYIIHTASPRYKYKYHTGSEQALFNCYLNVLQASKHYNLRTLALGNLALRQHDYPEQDAIHLGVRVLRRFLEQFPESFDLIVVCADNPRQLEIYRSTMKLYFPRNEHEERWQCCRLPMSCLGGPMGEPIIPERQIRIQADPIKTLHDQINDSGLDSSDELSLGSSLENGSDGFGSEINIDECRERLIELHYNEEFEDYDNEHHHHHHHHIHSPSGDGEHLAGSLSSSIGSPKFRSSSFLHAFDSILGDNHAHHAHHQHHDQYDGNDQLMLSEHRRRLKLERLFRKTRHMEKDLGEDVKQRLDQAIFIARDPDCAEQRDEQQQQSTSATPRTLVIIGQQVAQLFRNEFHSNFDYILAHLLRLLEKITRHHDGGGGGQYVVLYFHTMVDSLDSLVAATEDDHHNGDDEVSKTQLLNRLYEYLGQHHWAKLKSFLIVHPSIMNRLYVWWLKTFHYGKFLKNKVFFIQRLNQLKDHGLSTYNPAGSSRPTTTTTTLLEQLPKFILDFDERL